MALRLSKPLIALASFFALANVGAGCEPEVVRDPTFRTWCGDQLCAWTTEVGVVARAPTWHRRDYGVELMTTPTTIAQETDASDARCLTFTTVADVEASAQVTIGVDFDRDGSVDFEQPIAETGFRQVRTELTPPLAYDGIRFAVTKRGVGRAVLAEIRVQQAGVCRAPPIELKAKALGVACSADSPGECASGVCCAGVCAECCDPAALGLPAEGGGLVEPPAASLAACPGAAACVLRPEALAGLTPDVPRWLESSVPMQCEPGQGLRAAGAACLADDDCASGACEGASVEASPYGAGDAAACAGARFPSPGPEGCRFDRVRGGQCR